jgi:hypothetical protein
MKESRRTRRIKHIKLHDLVDAMDAQSNLACKTPCSSFIFKKINRKGWFDVIVNVC